MTLKLADCMLPLEDDAKLDIKADKYLDASSDQALIPAIRSAEKGGYRVIVVKDAVGRHAVSVDTVLNYARQFGGPDTGAIFKIIDDDKEVREHFQQHWDLVRRQMLRGHLHLCPHGPHLVSKKPCPDHG